MTVCNLSPHRLPNIHDQQSLMLYWPSFSWCGRVHVSVQFDHQGGQYIENILWCANVTILRLYIACLNVAINVKSKMKNRRLELTSVAKPGESHGLTGTVPRLARQESAGGVFGWVWNQTNSFLWSKHRPLAGYRDPLPTLLVKLTAINYVMFVILFGKNAVKTAPIHSQLN